MSYPITDYQSDSYKLATIYGYYKFPEAVGLKELQASFIDATAYTERNKIREKINAIELRGDTIPEKEKTMYLNWSGNFATFARKELGDSGLKRLKALNALYNPVTTTYTSRRTDSANKTDTVNSSFEPTTTLGEVITNIADTIIPSLPEAQASSGVPLLPRLSISNITENSVIINWSSSGDGGSAITNWLYTLKNQDLDQQIKQHVVINKQQGGIAETSLTSGTNYRAYLIAVNAFGNSNEASISFKTLGVKVEPVVTAPVVTTPVITTPVVTSVISPIIIINAEVQSILTKFDNNDYTYPSWFNNNITWVKDGSITSNEFLNAFNNLLQEGTIIDKTIPIVPVVKKYDVNTYRINEFGGTYNQIIYNIDGNTLLQLESQFLVTIVGSPTPTDQEIKDFYNFVDTTIDETMVSQSIGAFKLENGKVTGEILYIANSSFNPYYYNKSISSIIFIKDQYGANVLSTPKVNNLNFTETQRDEKIQINEGVGDLDAIKIEFYVWKSTNDPQAFSLQKTEELLCVECGKCQVGYHRDFNNKCVPDGGTLVGGKSSILDKFMGATALIGTLALLGSKGR